MMHLFRSTAGLVVGISLLLAGATAHADKPPRYAALLANGERLEGNNLSQWHDRNAQPHLDGKPLLDPGKPLRWLRDRALLPGEAPRAFVEMHTGDRFPGTVIDYDPGTSFRFDTQHPHFRVQPEIELRPPSNNRRQDDSPLRVVASFVRRIVWQKRDRDAYEPNTVFYRDGRATSFRAARFGPGYVHLLLDDGNRRVAFSEIAEIHLAAVDPWQAYFDELAVLMPGLEKEREKPRLYQIETTEGLLVTDNYERVRIFSTGNHVDVERWVHALQPAWCLDGLYIPNGDIWARRMWQPHEVPLTRIRASAIRTHSPLSPTGRTPLVNRNVEGGPLRSAQFDFGWGFGVHANCELTFPLVQGVKALRGYVSLDRTAGKGGCVRARVFANSLSGPKLWESPLLIGSEMVADLGTIGLAGPAQQQNQLVLQVDAAHEGRPAGADPLDVRDTTDWHDLWIELDPAMIEAQVARRALTHFAVWRDWQPVASPKGELRWDTYRNELFGERGAWRPAVAVREEPLVLSRELTLGPDDNWLVVFVTRTTSSGPPPKLEVRVGGEPAAEYEVPLRRRGNEDHPPLAVSLVNYKSTQKPIKVEIRQVPQKEEGYLDWRSIALVDQLPHLYQAFEDQGVFTAIDGQQTGSATLLAEDRHYGTHSIKVTPSGKFRLTFPQPVPIREQPGWGEYRHIRFAFRKVGGGRLAVEVDREGAGERPARYDAGSGEPVGKSAKRLWNADLPNQWIVMTRDLYADFGTFDATGITIEVPEGDYALVDHIYLARRPEDFNLVPNAPPPELINQAARRDLARPVVEKGEAATVVIETIDGRVGTGVVITSDGEVLTAGHIVANPKQPCTIHLSDGRTVKGETRGIYRDIDLGLIKIADKGPFPFAERGNAHELPENQLYVGFAHGTKYEEGKKPTAHILNIRRAFRGMIWTDFDRKDYSAGGPLLNREGRVIGILTRRSEFGGFLFGRLEEFDRHIGRLRDGEVYGSWYPGVGPSFGLSVMATREGARVVEVTPNSPGASAGLKAGDIITKVDGRSVVSLEDIYAILSEKNAGQDCMIDYFRSGQMLQTKLLLAPRTP